ncbi:MAG: carbamoyltransferase HypF [bacterium]
MAKEIRIKGIVQGVGFRPFIHRLATEFGLRGWVMNDTEGVLVFAEGDECAVESFISTIECRAPKPALIMEVKVIDADDIGTETFEIIPSEHREGEVTAISPDLATCDDCLRELCDPRDRRFYYPFINCTHCGPRYSIIRELPYDRPSTSMSPFEMCHDCLDEYTDIADRRFHAQPNACEVCGPHYEILDSNGDYIDSPDPIIEACDMLRRGEILAVKGIGGFHLMADARKHDAVEKLRIRKSRPNKPFALMVSDIDTAQKICGITPSEAEHLASPPAPIVLLRKLAAHEIILPENIAPGMDRMGIFLPYSPIHHIIMMISGLDILIATSGNKRDEPIACDNIEAVRDLAGIADGYLVHNRDIVGRSDDSVGFVFEDNLVLTRRSRGYVPRATKMPGAGSPVLAVGADLKGAFALTCGNQAYLSPYLGDLTGEKSLALFDEVLSRYLGWLKISPTAVVCDLHPDYQSTILAEKFAEKYSIPLYRIQHHFAHALSVIAENRLKPEKYIAVAFDGHGYGEDGTIWGGEFLLVDGAEFERVGHIRTLPQPGGDISAKDARRMALTWAYTAYSEGFEKHIPKIIESLGENAGIIIDIISQNRAPLTSSAGRLFDAAACILGICCGNSFEGECPQKLTAIADLSEKSSYPFEISNGILDPSPAIRRIIEDKAEGVPLGIISARFHNGLAKAVVEMSAEFAEKAGTSSILLTGGVFQNPLFLELVVRGLREADKSPYWNSAVPPGDSGVALGQALFGILKSR